MNPQILRKTRVNTMTAPLPVCLCLLGVVAAAAAGEGIGIGYGDLHGARRNNSTNETWDVGWRVLTPREKDWGLKARYRDLEGVWYRDFDGEPFEGASVDVSCGFRRIKAKELLPERDSGLELPRLGILGDVMVVHRRDLSCPVRFRNDAGRVVLEDFLHQKAAWPDDKFAAWFHGQPSLEKRRTDVRRPSKDHGFDRYSLRVSFLDSTVLDGNGDGRWRPANGLMDILSYRLTLHLDWLIVVPATWFDVSAAGAGQVRFRYLSSDGVKNANFVLDPEFLPERGKVRIGIVGRPGRRGAHEPGFYVVQSARGHGVVLGKIGDSGNEDHLSIVRGTLLVQPGGRHKGPDRIPQGRRRWFGPEQNYNWTWSEHSYWENRGIQDYDHPPFHARGGRFGYWGYSTYLDPYVAFTMPLRLNPHPSKMRSARRYGNMASLWVYPRRPINPASCPRAFMGECLNPRDGTFHREGFDWANPEGIAWRREQYRQLFLPYRGVAPFIQPSEVGGSLSVGYDKPFWSEAALKSFREYTGDPNARFPTDTYVPETARTTNKTVDEDWRRYFVWQRWVYASQYLAIAEGAADALCGDPYYRGAVFFASDDQSIALKRGVDLERIAASPAYAMLVCEYPKAYEPHCRYWHDVARKNGKRFVVLKGEWEFAGSQDVIRGFKQFGVDIDADGLIICGTKLPRLRLWLALASKYYGKGQMTPAQAEAIIREWQAEDETASVNTAMPAKGLVMGTDAQKVTIPRVRGVRVDGELSDWQSVERHGVDRFLLIRDEARAREAGWCGPDDLSGHFHIGYDDEALYFGGRIRDEVVITRGRTSREFASTGADEFKLFIACPDPRVGGESSSSHQLTALSGWDKLSVGFEEPEAVEGTDCALRIVDDGYVVEAGISWGALGCGPVSGGRVAFDVYVIDRDSRNGGLEKAFRIFSSGRKKPWQSVEHWAAGVLE